MKVTHVIHSIDRIKGGPSTYMQLLTSELVKQKIKIDVSTEALAQVEVVTLDTPDPIPLSPPITHHQSPQAPLGLFGYSSEIRTHLEKIDTNLFHGNGLWQYPVHAMSAAARKRKIPYILSTHGMLEPWSMTQGKLKKQIAMKLFQKKDLQRANVIHCTAKMEAKTIREMGFMAPIAVIPNGIDETEFIVQQDESPGSSTVRPDATIRQTPQTLLFLSRIHRKKGLEMLFQAFSSLDSHLRKDWQIVVAGTGEQEYLDSLKKLVTDLELSEDVHWAGEVYGENRKQLFQQADLFVLPTHSENFGIVVAEALASGVPVITTKGAPWEDLETSGCGWWTAISEESIQSALKGALSKSPKGLEAMGTKGRKLVEDKYSINKVARQMLELYQWVLGEGKRPEFVV